MYAIEKMVRAPSRVTVSPTTMVDERGAEERMEAWKQKQREAAHQQIFQRASYQEKVARFQSC